MTRVQTQQALRQLPIKWALGLLACLVLYALVQPQLNSRLGWHLPSLAKLMGEAEPPESKAKKAEPAQKTAQNSPSPEEKDQERTSKSRQKSPEAETKPLMQTSPDRPSLPSGKPQKLHPKSRLRRQHPMDRTVTVQQICCTAFSKKQVENATYPSRDCSTTLVVKKVIG